MHRAVSRCLPISGESSPGWRTGIGSLVECMVLVCSSRVQWRCSENMHSSGGWSTRVLRIVHRESSSWERWWRWWRGRKNKTRYRKKWFMPVSSVNTKKVWWGNHHHTLPSQCSLEGLSSTLVPAGYKRSHSTWGPVVYVLLLTAAPVPVLPINQFSRVLEDRREHPFFPSARVPVSTPRHSHHRSS